MSESEKSLAERITDALLAIPTKKELTAKRYQALQELGRIFAELPKAEFLCSFLAEVSDLVTTHSEPAALRAELTRRGYNHELIEMFLTYQQVLCSSESAQARRAN